MEEMQMPSGLTVIKDAPRPFVGKQKWFDEIVNVADAFFQRTLITNEQHSIWKNTD
jgi:arylsulfatase A